MGLLNRSSDVFTASQNGKNALATKAPSWAPLRSLQRSPEPVAGLRGGERKTEGEGRGGKIGRKSKGGEEGKGKRTK